MTTVEETVARLQEIIEAQQEQLNAMQQRQADIPEMLAQQRQGVETALDMPPRSMPEGTFVGDMRLPREKRKAMGIAKMEAVARGRGGRWYPDQPSIYGHRKAALNRKACEHFEVGGEGFIETCQRTCWTPEVETRFLYALGLKEMASATLVPLTPPDPKDNRDALLDLLGLLKSGAASNASDVTGQYPDRNPTRDEVGTAQSVRRAR